jgi:hypothetical protein
MSPEVPLTVSQIVVQVCLLLVAAIAIFGGSLQMYLGQPDTAPRLDNVHRFWSGLAALALARNDNCLIYLMVHCRYRT